MMKQLTVQLEEGFYNQIKKESEERKVSMSVLIRERIEQSHHKADATKTTHLGIEKIMLGMTLQTLGLVRFLVTQINEDTVKEAMEKSDEVVESFYRQE